jgi:hypothetical protein
LRAFGEERKAFANIAGYHLCYILPLSDRSHRRRQDGGATVPENLALACIHCNRYKGPNIAGIDPENGAIVRLFHPRRHIWNEHLVWDGPRLVALTSIGRVTIDVLAINDPEMVALREAIPEESLDENKVRW